MRLLRNRLAARPPQAIARTSVAKHTSDDQAQMPRPTPPLLRAPFLYPLAGIVHVLTSPALLLAVLWTAATMFRPWKLMSASMRARARARLFLRVLTDKGVSANEQRR